MMQKFRWLPETGGRGQRTYDYALAYKNLYFVMDSPSTICTEGVERVYRRVRFTQALLGQCRHLSALREAAGHNWASRR